MMEMILYIHATYRVENYAHPAQSWNKKGPDMKVLSVQSHVVHGCVGNRAAALPLQLLGVETDVLNTVQFSNTPDHGSFAGEKLAGEELWRLLEGLHANHLLTPSYLLTGYMGSVAAVRALLRALPLLPAGYQFWCDPVLGDHGRLYVPEELVRVYREEVVPHAYALLPNQFEAELLSGVTIRTVSDARRACAMLHARGVHIVVITSCQLEARMSGASPPLTLFYSRRQKGQLWRREYRLDVQPFDARFSGTGDLLAVRHAFAHCRAAHHLQHCLAHTSNHLRVWMPPLASTPTGREALLLGWSCRPAVPVRDTLRRAVSSVQAVLRAAMRDEPQPRASADGTRKPAIALRLEGSIDAIRCPAENDVPPPTRLDAPLQGVIFDMDGTLTLPGQLDFKKMREAVGLPEGASIFAGINAMEKEARNAAWAVIEAMEIRAFEQIKLQPGLSSLVTTLKKNGICLAIATRNSPRAVRMLLKAAGLPDDTFDPVLTRESAYPDKPDPAIVLAACNSWGLPPASCLMVGDTMDDMECGSKAGCDTCLLQPIERAGMKRALEEPESVEKVLSVGFVISALSELEGMVANALESS